MSHSATCRALTFASAARFRKGVEAFRERWVPRRGPGQRKVLILSSTILRSDGGLLKQGRLWLPALNVALLAALTPPDWEPEILYETVEDVPWETDADVVAISGMGVGLWRGLQIADEFRRRGKTVIVGGPMASLVPELVQERCDAVCVGDAETLWEPLLRDFEEGSLKPSYTNLPRLRALGEGCVHSLPGIPMPRYDLMVEKPIGFWLPVLVGRGCPHRCEFCSIQTHYAGRYLRRPVDDVVRDAEAVRSLGIRRVLLIDDNLGADPAYALELFDRLKGLGIRWMGQCALTVARRPDLVRAMAESGCTTISCGLESVNQESLEGVGKRFARVEEYEKLLGVLRRHGIDVSSEMILGLDGDGPDVFARTAEFVLRNRIRAPRFYLLTPVPGTPLYERLEREGRIVDRDFSHYTAAKAVFEPRGLSAAELEAGYWSLYERVFSIPNILRRFGVRIPNGFLPCLFLLGANFHYRSHIRKRICPGIV